MAGHINLQIQQQIDANVASLAEPPDEINDRLDQHDHESDIERTLEANAASFSLLGLTVDRRWLALPVGVAASLLQLPVPLFRRRITEPWSRRSEGIQAPYSGSPACRRLSDRRCRVAASL